MWPYFDMLDRMTEDMVNNYSLGSKRKFKSVTDEGPPAKKRKLQTNKDNFVREQISADSSQICNSTQSQRVVDKTGNSLI